MHHGITYAKAVECNLPPVTDRLSVFQYWRKRFQYVGIEIGYQAIAHAATIKARDIEPWGEEVSVVESPVQLPFPG